MSISSLLILIVLLEIVIIFAIIRIGRWQIAIFKEELLKAHQERVILLENLISLARGSDKAFTVLTRNVKQLK